MYAHHLLRVHLPKLTRSPGPSLPPPTSSSPPSSPPCVLPNRPPLLTNSPDHSLSARSGTSSSSAPSPSSGTRSTRAKSVRPRQLVGRRKGRELILLHSDGHQRRDGRLQLDLQGRYRPDRQAGSALLYSSLFVPTTIRADLHERSDRPLDYLLDYLGDSRAQLLFRPVDDPPLCDHERGAGGRNVCSVERRVLQ